MPRKLAPPKYARHSSGQARVRIDGRVVYLGEYGSPASRDRYAREIAKWQSRQEATRTCLTVDHLALLFMEHAKGHYRKNGRPTSEIDCLRTALQYLVDVHGPTAVSDFGPKALKAVRQAMIDDERHCRNTINGHVSRIRRVFRWGVENEFVPPEVYHGLLAVQGLQQGRSEARETEPVSAVAVEAVNAVRPFVTLPVWAMIELQLLTGMRPGEVIIMRGCDITQAGRIWEYVPHDHKTEHHGKRRIIFLGPKAQAQSARGIRSRRFIAGAKRQPAHRSNGNCAANSAAHRTAGGVRSRSGSFIRTTLTSCSDNGPARNPRRVATCRALPQSRGAVHAGNREDRRTPHSSRSGGCAENTDSTAIGRSSLHSRMRTRRSKH